MIAPQDLLTQGVARFETELRAMSRQQLGALSDDLVGLARPLMTDDVVSGVCLDFAVWMAQNEADKKLIVDFCLALGKEAR